MEIANIGNILTISSVAHSERKRNTLEVDYENLSWQLLITVCSVIRLYTGVVTVRTDTQLTNGLL